MAGIKTSQRKCCPKCSQHVGWLRLNFHWRWKQWRCENCDARLRFSEEQNDRRILFFALLCIPAANAIIGRFVGFWAFPVMPQWLVLAITSLALIVPLCVRDRVELVNTLASPDFWKDADGPDNASQDLSESKIKSAP